MKKADINIPSVLQPYDEALKRLGKQWITQHRVKEIRECDAEKRRAINGYFANEALASFEDFKRNHFDAKPNQGGGGSSIAERVKYFYPELFRLLRCRLEALFTQPELKECRVRFELLEDAYYTDLAAAYRLARHLNGRDQKDYLYLQCRHAFYGAHHPLRGLLADLVAFGNQVRGEP